MNTVLLMLEYFVLRENCIFVLRNCSVNCMQEASSHTISDPQFQSRQLLMALSSPASRGLCNRASRKYYRSSEVRWRLNIFCLHLTFYHALDLGTVAIIPSCFGTNLAIFPVVVLGTEGSPILHI